MKEKIDAGEWLQGAPQQVEGRLISPYLVGDSAFALSNTLLKGYDHPPQPGPQRAFNAAVVKARRTVEIAFGHTKGRFHVLMDNFINDPKFAADVALVCCALNNICIRARCPFYDSWLAEDGAAPHAGHGAGGPAVDVGEAPGVLMRLALAQYLHGNFLVL